MRCTKEEHVHLWFQFLYINIFKYVLNPAVRKPHEKIIIGIIEKLAAFNSFICIAAILTNNCFLNALRLIIKVKTLITYNISNTI